MTTLTPVVPDWSDVTPPVAEVVRRQDGAQEVSMSSWLFTRLFEYVLPLVDALSS